MQAPTIELEQPLSVDVSGGGCVALLDRRGERLVVSGRDPVTLDRPARAVRFYGESVVLLFADGTLRTPSGERKGDADPTDLAVAPSGSVYVIAGGVLERISESPLRHAVAGTVLAADTGGVWVCGKRVIGLRPVPDGLEARSVEELPSPARSAAVGPDGELYVLVDGGLWRDGETTPLDVHLSDIAAGPDVLVGCGPAGFADLTHMVPRAEGDGPQFDLPSCST